VQLLSDIIPAHLKTFGTESWKIIHGDCLDILRQLPNESIFLVITSPPYNLGISSGGGLKGGLGSGKWKSARLAHGYGEHDDAMPKEEYRSWQSEVLKTCWEKVRSDGAIYYNHKPRIQNGLLEHPMEWNPGLPLRQIIIWRRSGGINFSPTFYLPTHEYILLYAKPEFKLKSKGASGVGDVWDIKQETNNPHPAPFSVELPERILQSVPQIKDAIILDCFAGSSTTGVACIQNGFRYIGIELEEEFVEMSVKRLEKTDSKKRTALF